MRKKAPDPKRLLITLPPEDRAWLAKISHERGESMAEIVREAMAEYRTHRERRSERERLLERTFGIRKGAAQWDAAKYVEKLRDEWKP